MLLHLWHLCWLLVLFSDSNGWGCGDAGLAAFCSCSGAIQQFGGIEGRHRVSIIMSSSWRPLPFQNCLTNTVQAVDRSDNIQWKIPETNNSQVLNCMLFWVVWWNLMRTLSILPRMWIIPLSRISALHKLPGLSITEHLLVIKSTVLIAESYTQVTLMQ